MNVLVKPRITHLITPFDIARKTCNPLPEGGQVNPVSDYFLMSWTNTLKESKNEWDWLCANVGRLASEHGVEPEDLVLCKSSFPSS